MTQLEKNGGKITIKKNGRIDVKTVDELEKDSMFLDRISRLLSSFVIGIFVALMIIGFLSMVSCSPTPIEPIEPDDCGCVGTTMYYEDGVGYIIIERNQPLDGCPEEVEYEELEEGSGIYWIIKCDFI